MRKLLALVLLFGVIGFGTATPAQAQSGWCSDEYHERNIDSWQALIGDPFQDWGPTPNLDGFRSAPFVMSSGFGNGQDLLITRSYDSRPISFLSISIWATSLTERTPGILFTLKNGTSTIANFNSQLLTLAPQMWTTYNFEFGAITSDRIEVDIVQTTASDTPAYFYVRVQEICWTQPYSFPPDTATPVTATVTPSLTPHSTLRPTNTLVSTWTRTPTRTRTPGTHTPTKTETVGPGTITPTPTDPYDWTPPPGLNSGPFPTPTQRMPQLRWELPIPVFQVPDLNAPTLIPARATSTEPVSGTAVGYVSGAAVIGVDLSDSLTRVGQYREGVFAWQTQVFLDAAGTPMAGLRNQANLIASNIGGFFYVLRSVRDATGQIGDLVVILLLMIAFNIIIRFTVVGIGIVLFLWRALKSLIDLVAKTPALLIMLVVIVIIIVLIIVGGGASAGDWESATLTVETPVVTSTGSVTPTHTLIPLTPTSTPQFRGFRQTPTPIPINTTPIFDVSEAMPDASGQTADQVINAYKAINTGTRGGVDLLAFMALASITIGMAVRLVSRLNKDK